MPTVRLFVGSAYSRRTETIDERTAATWDRALLIVPTRRHADRRTAAFLKRLGRQSVLGRRVLTFREFALRILDSTGFHDSELTPLAQRMFLERAVARVRESGTLDALGAAADTEGFLHSLLHVITQLKQAEILPEQFQSRTTKRPSPMDTIVGETYAAYQDELNTAKAIDLQGMYWLSRIECEKQTPGALDDVDFLFLDAFDDFTPSEFSLIRAAAAHVDELAFGLNYDPNPNQRDLYQIPIETLGRIHRDFQESPIHDSPDLEEPLPDRHSAHVFRSLLLRDAVDEPLSMANDVELVECHTVDHEVETIARRIKQLIRDDGVAPHEIALVWRQPGTVTEIVQGVFDAFGIPMRGVGGGSLLKSSVANFVLHFLDTIDSWSVEGVSDILTSPYFGVTEGGLSQAFPLLTRIARPQPSRKSWKIAVEKLGHSLAMPPNREIRDVIDHVPVAVEACAALKSALERFAGQADSIPKQGTLFDFARALDALFARWPIAQAIGNMPEDSTREFETVAWREVRAVVGTLEQGARAEDAPLSRAEFATRLRGAYQLTEISSPGPGPGVHCLDMEAARHLRFEYVFLAGLTQGEVPAPRRANAIYGESDQHTLSARNLPFDNAADHSRREVLLFQRMFSTARTHLTLSWHGLTRGGQVTGQSLFVREVEDLLNAPKVVRAESERDVLVPSPELVACTRDLRNLAFAARTLPTDSEKHFARVTAAAAIESRRYGFETCDAHDGVLKDAANLGWSAMQYGPEHVFSVSQLESYRACPFRFFQERILRLFRVPVPEEGIGPATQGSVLHDALEAFHGSFPGKAVADIPAEDAQQAMQQSIDHAFKRAAAGNPHLGRGLLAAEKARLSHVLDRYLFIERERGDAGWTPHALEVAFGPSADGSATDYPAYELDLGKETINIAGRIDRIDRKDDRLRLIDYKSSTVRPKDIDSGMAFQLAVYALAAETFFDAEIVCEEAAYLAIGKAKGETLAVQRDGKKADWDTRIELAKRTITDCLDGIRAGRFAPTHEETACKGCATEKVCRYERARMRRKRSGSTAP